VTVHTNPNAVKSQCTQTLIATNHNSVRAHTNYNAVSHSAHTP